LLAAGDEPPPTEDAEVASTLWARPHAIEAVANGRIHGFTFPVDTEIEAGPPIDVKGREAAFIAVRIEEGGAVREAVAGITPETLDAVVGGDERTDAVWARADGATGFRGRIVTLCMRSVAGDGEFSALVEGADRRSVITGFVEDFFGSGQPGDRSVAGRIVDQDGPVWFREDHDRAAFLTNLVVFEPNRAIASEHPDCVL
jgi:hypothetical protein